ncbi:DNA-binding CsgD family transcriptional regulator/sugar-specific transcriptional regulator TrmB [Microlunatus panaciterrae]|uniref:DNA-binding CsgD family transcriptional regulator/sugar-specific transcriptional regulator TrmB n=1 Tax=Microlunatus panaciterrae TaxID=400768 RepID=A0ABS2RK87_9ACTN|nr:hypothetical protein [Microlunatus panaciterrae]MBM7799420.1 DNA-binding CsgD family transcriptional regulator/sugar-specific transcriptional regulator TrmB [Microlunatus panaciterrae]
MSMHAEALYVVLAPMEASTVPDLAQLSDRTVAEVEQQLAELQRLGMVYEMGGGQWQAVPVLEAAKGLQAQRIAELDAAMMAADALQSKLLAASESRSDAVSTVVGREAIISVRREICGAAKREVCGFDKPPYTVAPRSNQQELDEESPEWQALERGVSVRSVYHPGFDPERLGQLTMFAAHGEQARMGIVPMKLLLIDSSIALIPSMKSYTPGHELRASLIRHPMVVEALQWLFEAVWDSSVSIIASAVNSNGQDPRRELLISLLMTGSTDSAIASQLGVNERSVRRWVSELMEEFGVRTRLQLGAALVRSETLRHETSRLGS